MTAWSPGEYLKFEDERTRPARDLLAAVPLTVARQAVDIGCGPGNSTELIAQRYPNAEVFGFDNSPEMIAAARKRLPKATFAEADVATWTPAAPADLLFANAVFQWVPDHVAVLARLIGGLAPGGVLAVQMPDNFDEPSHFLMREAAKAEAWSVKLADAEGEREGDPGGRGLLRPAAAWKLAPGSTSGAPSTSTPWPTPPPSSPGSSRRGCGPISTGWTAGEQAAYSGRLPGADRRGAYPPRVDGRVLLHFPRIFIVAVRE